MPTLTELVESKTLERPRPGKSQLDKLVSSSDYRRHVRRPPQKPVSDQRAQVQAEHDVELAYEPKAPQDNVLKEVPPLEEFDTAYELFEPKAKPDRAAFARREKALKSIPELMEWIQKLKAQKARGEQDDNRLRANIAGWEKDAEAFLGACTENLAEAKNFWAEAEKIFTQFGEQAKEELRLRKQGILAELATKRALEKIGYEIRDNRFTDPLGADFLAQQKYDKLTQQPGGIAIHQVKSKSVYEEREILAMREPENLLERPVVSERDYTVGSKQQARPEMAGWKKLIRHFGAELPVYFWHIPFRADLIAENGVMNPGLEDAVRQAISRPPARLYSS